jgi:hypothetical protein
VVLIDYNPRLEATHELATTAAASLSPFICLRCLGRCQQSMAVEILEGPPADQALTICDPCEQMVDNGDLLCKLGRHAS